jgi:hypothetical protein
VAVVLGQDARDVQDSIVIDHPAFDQKNSARDLTNKYNTHGHEKTVEKQTVPPLVDSVQPTTAKQKAMTAEKRKLIQKHDAFVKQEVTEAKQEHAKAFQALNDPKAKMEKFDESAARRAAERRWSTEHKQEAKQLKAVESSGLTVPPLMNR